MTAVALSLNGDQVTLDPRDDETLQESLRDRVDLSSVRYACGIGVCGTCTVLVDGRPASSCLLLTAMVAGRSVVTAEAAVSEGVTGPDPELGRRVQQAFVEERAYQCSFCIPAMALTVQALLDRRPDSTDDELREQLGGNLCRCGTYPDVLAAVHRLTTSASAERGEQR
jgi:aerobic-type carbon monoxide dehydrogenase small subunit (CoxS/CutS family)